MKTGDHGTFTLGDSDLPGAVMKDFTASNGTPVKLTDDGLLLLFEIDYTYPVTVARGNDVEALREFFRAEEDERLGRWRWPESPQWVLYPDEDGGVVALDESTGESTSTLSRLTVSAFPDTWGCPAARAYFDAHPGSKPIPSEPHTAWVDKYGTDVPFTRLVPLVKGTRG